MKLSVVVVLAVALISIACQKSYEKSSIQTYTKEAFGVKNWVVLHVEGNKWFVDHFAAKEGQLQDLVSQKYFTTFTDAKEYADSIKPNIEIISQGIAGQTSSITEQKNKVIWKVENEWSLDWEKKYGAWVTENIDSEFFKKFNIATDCADVAYATRMIFSRINLLPYAVHLGGSSVLFSQDSMKSEWGNLPASTIWADDKLFREALKYILANTYTHTLMSDAYPVKIDKDNFRPGHFNLSLGDTSGHTMLFNRVTDDPNAIPVEVVYSTVPQAVRSLAQAPYMESWAREEGKNAILGLPWPKRTEGGKWTLTKWEDMPAYSLEQFDEKFIGEDKAFYLAVYKRINPNINFPKMVESAITNLKEQLTSRKAIVETGFEFCSKNPCPETSAAYEEHSTPNRDARIKGIIAQIKMIIENFGNNFPEIEKSFSEELMKPLIEIEGSTYPLGALVFAFKNNLNSYNPSDIVEKRWGISGKAVFKYVKENFEKSFSDRIQKIKEQGTVCSSEKPCDTASDTWLKWQTFEIDSPLQSIVENISDYILYAPTNEALAFETLISDNRLNANSLDLSIKEWFQRILVFNSDPRVSAEKRWGAKDTLYNIRLHKTPNKLLITKNGYIYIEEKTKLYPQVKFSKKLYNLYSDKELSLPAGLEVLAMDELRDTLVLVNKEEEPYKVYLMQPGNDPVLLHTFEGLPTEVKWLSSGVLFVRAMGDFIFDVRTEEIKQYGPYSYINKDVYNFACGLVEKNKYMVLDYGSTPIKEYEVESDSDKLLGEYNNYLVFKKNDDNDYYFIDKYTKTITPVSFKYNVVQIINSKFLIAQESDDVFQLNLNDKLELIEATTLGKGYAIFDQHNKMISILGSEGTIYDITPDKLNKIPKIDSKEEFDTTLKTRNVISRINSKMIVRPLYSKEPLLEGLYVIPSGLFRELVATIASTSFLTNENGYHVLINNIYDNRKLPLFTTTMDLSQLGSNYMRAFSDATNIAGDVYYSKNHILIVTTKLKEEAK